MKRTIALLLVVACLGCGSSSPKPQASAAPTAVPGPPAPPGPGAPPAPPSPPTPSGPPTVPNATPLPPPPTVNAFTPPAHGQLAGSINGEYAVWFPSAPSLEEPPGSLAALGARQVQFATASGADLEKSMVLELAFDQPVAADKLAEFQRTFTTSNPLFAEARLNPVKFLNRDALEVSIENGLLGMRAVFFAEGNSLFGIMWAGPPPRRESEDVKTFFASFHRRAPGAPALPALAKRSAESSLLPTEISLPATPPMQVFQMLSLGGGEFAVRLPLLGQTREEPKISELVLSGDPPGTQARGTLRSWTGVTAGKSIVGVTELTMPEDVSPKLFAEFARLHAKPMMIVNQANRMAANLHALQVDGDKQRYVSCYCGRYAFILHCIGNVDAGDVQEFFASFRTAGTSPPTGLTATEPIPFLRPAGDMPPELSASTPTIPPSIPGAPMPLGPPVDEARRFELLDGFQIVMPEGDVKKYEAPVQKRAGVTEERIELKIDKSGTYKVTVDQSKFSAKVPETFVKTARERAKRDKTFQETQLTVAGFPTLQQEFGDKIKTRIQLIHTGESLVRLTWIGDPDSPESKEFFSSFGKKDGAAAPQAAPVIPMPMPEPGARSKAIPSGL